ncbi:unnamed protein product [Pylaiella littoralis]
MPVCGAWCLPQTACRVQRGPPEWLPLRRHEMHKRHEPGGERSAQLHFRDAAALKSRTHVACPAPAESCGAGTSCLAQDGTSKLSRKCPHGWARHFLCMRVPCPEGCGDVHGAAAQGNC